jgi:tetratricopeptide (TPR) repeat protein
MPPFDREGALKSAEKALRQGRIDAAIAEYVKIVEKQPRDWNSANALGDLYVRAGQIDKGVQQYVKIADHLATEGFYPKAAALFKKILKIKPDEEYALLQSAELSSKQGLLADAKNSFRAVADRRKARGDKKGAAEISVRIGTLDPEDLEARLGAARAAADIGDVSTAFREFREVAHKYADLGREPEALSAFQAAFEINKNDSEIRERLLTGYIQAGDLVRARTVAHGSAELKQIALALGKTGRTDDELDVLAEVAQHDPSDLQVRAGLAQAYARKGDLERARTYLSPETAGSDPALWLTLAEIELNSGRFDQGRAAVAQALTLNPASREAAVVLGCRLAERSGDAGYPCIDAVADAALAQNDYAAAAAALHEFVTRVRYHVIALMRLVDICVDGGLEATMYEAQAQLADAYLEVGRGLEARIISEDLVAREPWNRANIERFRRALVMLGEGDPDSIIADRLSGESPFLATDKLDLNEGFVFDDEKPVEATAAAAAPPPPPPPPPAPAKAKQAKAAPKAAEAAAPASPTPPTPPPAEPARGAGDDAASEQYRLALTYRDLGMVEDAVKALEIAARSPRQRFDAAALLGRIYLEQGNRTSAVEWFERAAEAPAPTQDASRALLYELGETFESIGERSRALAVFMELESESGGYRDVAGRIERLSKVQAKG